MKKLKIYLDTSVISHLLAEDTPEKMADTHDDEVKQLAGQIIQMGILKEKNLDDCLHIAAALLSSCQYIISWNFKHMVNVKTINGVRAITSLSGYRPIDLIAPTLLIQGDD